MMVSTVRAFVALPLGTALVERREALGRELRR